MQGSSIRVYGGDDVRVRHPFFALPAAALLSLVRRCAGLIPQSFRPPFSHRRCMPQGAQRAAVRGFPLVRFALCITS